MITLPIEFELAAAKICADCYPHSRFNLITQVSSNCVDIHFYAYFSGTFSPLDEYYPNPTDNYYRRPDIDTFLLWGGGNLVLSGRWRDRLLSLHYTPTKSQWMDEDGQEVPKPYPDGDEFEALAVSLYPLMSRYFCG